MSPAQSTNIGLEASCDFLAAILHLFLSAARKLV